MWQFNTLTGEFRKGSVIKGHGYSGFGVGKNNPAMEGVEGVGPIPRGRYKIGPAYKDAHLGPIVMHVDPVGHSALGRTLFRIHGDNATGTASHGCIILNHDLREEVSLSEDRELWVV